MDWTTTTARGRRPCLRRQTERSARRRMSAICMALQTTATLLSSRGWAQEDWEACGAVLTIVCCRSHAEDSLAGGKLAKRSDGTNNGGVAAAHNRRARLRPSPSLKAASSNSGVSGSASLSPYALWCVPVTREARQDSKWSGARVVLSKTSAAMRRHV